uniref:Thromboxane-A synthase n=1 Tax=Aceria tosichella TaxID=561515 RepID=A0A6G1SLY8_9ACAR
MDNLKQQLREPNSWLPVVVSVTVLYVCYSYYVNYYNYWASRGIKGSKPFFVFNELYDIYFVDRFKKLRNAVEKYGKIYGTFSFGKPRLVIADPEVIRQICIKDFDAFQNHIVSPFANRYQKRFLVWLQDDEWMQVRSRMVSTFTNGKMKRMYKLLDGCSEDLVNNFKEQYIMARRAGKQAADVDLFNTYSMYTMDGITSCCYSLHLARQKSIGKPKRGVATRNSLVEDANKVFKFDPIRLMIAALTPKFILKATNFTLASESSWQGLVKRLEQLIEKRRHGEAGTGVNDDLMQMLLDANEDDEVELNELDRAENHHAGLTHETLQQDQAKLKASIMNDSNGSASVKSNTKLKLSDMDVLSNSILMLSAGLDTTRSSLSSITYLLAHHQDVQERLYQELKKIAKYEETAMGKRLVFEYDDLTTCQYLDAVISESLRMVPPAPFTDRQAKRDYFIKKYGVSVPKDSQILLAFYSVHHDPDYWSEPDKFNPDRFMPGEREKIVPGSYAPFSMGPRHCIGMRFSLTETKLGLAKVLMNFKFQPAPGTVYPPVAALGLGLVAIKNCKARVTLRDLD